MRYACELLNGSPTRRRVANIEEKYPAAAAEYYCAALADAHIVNFDDGQIVAVQVTAAKSGQSVICNVTVRAKIAHTFSAVETV